MSKRKIIGYIVICGQYKDHASKMPMRLDECSTTGETILFFADGSPIHPKSNADDVTLFDTYEQARSAVRKSIRNYNSLTTENRTWDWMQAFGKPQIMRVTKGAK